MCEALRELMNDEIEEEKRIAVEEATKEIKQVAKEAEKAAEEAEKAAEIKVAKAEREVKKTAKETVLTNIQKPNGKHGVDSRKGYDGTEYTCCRAR